jgi:hypothetical protein
MFAKYLPWRYTTRHLATSLHPAADRQNPQEARGVFRPRSGRIGFSFRGEQPLSGSAKAEAFVVSMGGGVPTARSAAALAAASMGGGVPTARSVAAQHSVSMGGSVPNARSVAALAFASTGGSVTDARSVVVQAPTITSGSRMAVGAAVPSDQSEILRGSTLLLSNTKPRKLPRSWCSTQYVHTV